MVFRGGGEFDYIKADDPATLESAFDKQQGLMPGGTARNRSTGGADYRGVEAVDIKGEIDGARKFGRQRFQRDALRKKLSPVQVPDGRVVLAEEHLVARQGADAELKEGHAQIHHGPSGHTGMAVGRAFEAVAQVAVGIDLNQADRFLAVCGYRLQGPYGDGVLAAEYHRDFAGCQDFGCGGLDPGQHGFWRSLAIDKGSGMDAQLERTGAAIPVLQLLRGMEDGCRATFGAADVGNRLFHRYGDEVEGALIGGAAFAFGGEEIRGSGHRRL